MLSLFQLRAQERKQCNKLTYRIILVTDALQSTILNNIDMVFINCDQHIEYWQK